MQSKLAEKLKEQLKETESKMLAASKEKDTFSKRIQELVHKNE